MNIIILFFSQEDQQLHKETTENYLENIPDTNILVSNVQNKAENFPNCNENPDNLYENIENGKELFQSKENSQINVHNNKDTLQINCENLQFNKDKYPKNMEHQRCLRETLEEVPENHITQISYDDKELKLRNGKRNSEDVISNRESSETCHQHRYSVYSKDEDYFTDVQNGIEKL